MALLMTTRTISSMWCLCYWTKCHFPFGQNLRSFWSKNDLMDLLSQQHHLWPTWDKFIEIPRNKKSCRSTKQFWITLYQKKRYKNVVFLRSLSMILRDVCVCWSFVGRFNNLSLLCYADLCLSSDKENNYEANECAFVTVAV